MYYYVIKNVNWTVKKSELVDLLVDKVTSEDNNTTEWLQYDQEGDMADKSFLNRGIHTNKCIKRVFHPFLHYLIAPNTLATFWAYAG